MTETKFVDMKTEWVRKPKQVTISDNWFKASIEYENESISATRQCGY